MPRETLLIDRLVLPGFRARAMSLAVAPGERIVLLGPPGSGKTLLLHVLAGFARAAGRLVLDGIDLAGVGPEHRRIGFLPAVDTLFAHRSAAENAAFGLALRGVARRDRLAPAMAALARVGLDGMGTRRADRLDPPQRRLVALARALCVEPALLLADAPSDDDELLTAMARARLASIAATADPRVALAHADRVVLLRDGGIEQIGPPATLYERPATRFAASYTGECNFVPRDGRVLAIRPARVRVGGPGEPARVERVAYQGAATRVALRAQDGGIVLADLPAAPAGLAPGMATTMAWDETDSWPLPPDS